MTGSVETRDNSQRAGAPTLGATSTAAELLLSCDLHCATCAPQRCLRILIESSNSSGRSKNIVTHHSECCQLVQSLKDLQ